MDPWSIGKGKDEELWMDPSAKNKASKVLETIVAGLIANKVSNWG